MPRRREGADPPFAEHAATTELARKLLSFLFRARHDPALRFAAWFSEPATFLEAHTAG